MTKFGDNCSTTSLINDLSNLKTNSGEKIKDFNSIFNKLLNKIPTTSRPVVDVQFEWYLSSLPSNTTIFVDNANKNTLVENMKEVVSIKKGKNALERKKDQEDRKLKRVTFKDEAKKKAPKDPFDLEGLQEVFKTLSNDIVDIKKQVVEYSSRKPLRPFKRYHPPNPQPPNTISNVETDDEDEEEATFSADESQDEKIAKLNGMLDFILLISDGENKYEELPISTRSKGPIDLIQPIQ